MLSDTPAYLEIGSLFGNRYEIVATLGNGATGWVALARDHRLKLQTVALKVLYARTPHTSNGYARFEEEVRLMRELNSPNIVRIFEFGVDSAGQHFLTMEYIEGQTLRERLNASPTGRLPFAEATDLLKQILRGVADAHLSNIVHRDLKPDNILIGLNGEVKITDFGLARALEDDYNLTKTGELLGTPYYMAPEQILGQSVDTRTDVYSLGLLSYELVTGKRPFEADSYFELAQHHLYSQIEDFARARVDVPIWFQDFVQKSSSKVASQRFSNAEEMLEVLESRLQIPSRAHLERFYWSISSKRKVKRRLYASVFLVMILVISFYVIVTSQKRRAWCIAMPLLAIEKYTDTNLRSLKQVFGFAATLTPSSLIESFRDQKPTLAEVLLWLGVDNRARDAKGTPAIFYVLATAGDQGLHTFLEYGAGDINTLNAEGVTPLVFAATNGGLSLDAIKLLVASGADINLPTTTGLTPLHSVIENRGGRGVQITAFLLAQGANVNAQDNAGRTPLMVAAVSGENEQMDLLKKYGADPAMVSLDGKNALQHAHTADAIKKLLSLGVPIDQRNRNGQSALGSAVTSGNNAFVKLLLEYGASPDILDNNGSSPLAYSVSANTLSISKMLLEHRADPNLSDPLTDLPLFVAVRSDDLKHTKILLQHGALPNTPNTSGRTAIYLAVRNKNAEIVQLLLEHGADPSLPDKQGGTAFDLAKRLAETGSGSAKNTLTLLEQHLSGQ